MTMANTTPLAPGRPLATAVRRRSAPMLAAAGLVALAAAGCAGPSPGDEPAAQAVSDTAESVTLLVASRSAEMPNYPCSECHLCEARPTATAVRDEPPREPDPRQRPLEELHQRIEVSHGELGGWCYRCHSLVDIDQLVLPDQSLLSYDESYRLCGACHGEKLGDWQRGIHGLVTGRWNGPRLVQPCSACHDPHDPSSRSETPRPPPQRPRTAALAPSLESAP